MNDGAWRNATLQAIDKAKALSMGSLRWSFHAAATSDDYIVCRPCRM